MRLANLYPSFFPTRRKIAASGLIAFVGGVLIGALLLSLTPISPSFNVFGQPLLKFNSYEELVSFVNTTSGYPYYARADVVGLAEAKSGASVDYSSTNIQVAGVDEADIVKTDGEYLYIVSNQSIFIVKASVMDARIVSRIELKAVPHGLFINEDKLVVFGARDYGYMLADTLYRPYYWHYSTPLSFIYVYNVTNRASPVLARNVTLDGSYFSSRMIGDYVYTVIIEPTWVNGSEIKLPVVHTDGVATSISATEIYYSNVTDYGYSFTTILAVNVQDDAEEPTHETILMGATSNIYVSLNNIYITLQGSYDAFGGIEKTLIYRIGVEGSKIQSQASGEVPGRLLNQFSMDEHGGYFRVATSTGSLWGARDSQNHVYVLNMSLGIVGRLEGLAPRETIYSARFMGDKFYLVTFRSIDPLFVIDLQDPENPHVLGELKITGYSDYLHPYDKKHVIGVGKETIAASEDFAWYQGVKISLFNVSDPLNPTEIAKAEIGDRGTDSPVLRDHKAFLFDKDRQLLVIPVLVAEIDASKYPGDVPPYAYGDYVWQGVYIYNITLQGFELRGNVTHIDNGAGLRSNYYYFSPFSVKRALYIGNVLYTISDKMVKMNSLDNLQEIGSIELP